MSFPNLCSFSFIPYNLQMWGTTPPLEPHILGCPLTLWFLGRSSMTPLSPLPFLPVRGRYWPSIRKSPLLPRWSSQKMPTCTVTARPWWQLPCHHLKAARNIPITGKMALERFGDTSGIYSRIVYYTHTHTKHVFNDVLFVLTSDP